MASFVFCSFNQEEVMQDQQAVHNQESPSENAANDSSMGASAHSNDRRHRHTMDWPEIMLEEGLPIRG
ncbi:MAG: hypothetical protein WA058_02270 [Minisyncoccia bacterium]